MHDTRYVDAGSALLRVVVGALMLLHGVHKLRHGIDGVMKLLANQGLPTSIGYLVYLGEFVAPVMLIVGIYTRVAALMVAGTMTFAIYLAHSGDVFSLSPKGGGWAIELQALYLFGAIAIALLGPDRHALGRRIRGLRG
jgi:putative oxidoreductase